MNSTQATASPGTDASDWAAWRDLIWRDPLDRDRIKSRLLALAPRVRRRLGPRGALTKEWEPLGLQVDLARMRARGSAYREGSHRTILINADDRIELKRFTAAHELAHLLLAPPDPVSDILRPADEEQFCEAFAQELLIPTDEIHERIQREGPPSPEQVLRLCGEYRVNVRPMLSALARHVKLSHHLLLARWRAHPKRHDALAFRVDASAGDARIFFPRDQGIATLGLRELAAEGQQAAHGQDLDGADQTVTVELRGLDADPPSSSVEGPVSWQAVRQGHHEPYLLAVLDLRAALEHTALQ